MNSLRPLVTITVLVVVCAFLYVKLNEGPKRQATGAMDPWPYQSPAGVPPLHVNAGAATLDASAPPAWNQGMTDSPITAPEDGTAMSPQSGTPAVPPLVASEASIATATPPTVPAVPTLPELPGAIQPQPVPELPNQPTSPPEIPTHLPANVPIARYPDQAPGAELNGPGPALNAPATTPFPPAASIPPATQLGPTEASQTPESANAASADAMNLATPPLASQPNPLRSVPEPQAPADRYGAAALESTASSPPPESVAPPAAPITPIQETFAASWPVIQAALNRGELAQAHQQLSRWYHDPSLTPTDAERVESLLSQLAGTVVYSTEHRLEPPHVVKAGETLESIAQQYNVPWQLLAKINGIPAASAVQPGQELKVLRGPFSAIVDLDRNELVLMLDGRYAGKFAVTPPPGNTVNEGELVVARTLDLPQQGQLQRLLVLQRQGPGNAAGPSGLVLGAVSAEQLHQQGMGLQEPIVALSPADASELSDILSVGSRVEIRR